MKIIDKGVEIETHRDGKKTVKEKLDIECESEEEAERVETALKQHLEESLRKLEDD